MANNVKITGLDLKGLKDHLKNLLGDKMPGVKVGVLDGATYSEGPLKGEYVAQNLARTEYGTATIPARAPFRSTIEKKKAAWSKAAVAYLQASDGHIDVRAALTQVGDVVAMDIQQSFEDGLTPSLKQETIMQKYSMTREGTREKGGQPGDYAANAATPGMLTGQSQKAIEAQYVDDLSTVVREAK